MKMRFALPVALAVAAVAALPVAASADTIRVQGTTDTVDAGWVDDMLIPAYKQAHPEDTIQYTPVGTSKAIDNAKQGLADLVLTHAPTIEQQFVADGYSFEPFGRQLFYSDYVIVGPQSDPAGVLAKHRHDAVGALEDIAAAGGMGGADFLSRGDASGTNVQEQIMWALTGAGVAKHQTAANRAEPGATTNPPWYHKTNKGQAANLLEADACPAGTYPSGNCYTIVDRGTFNRQVNTGTVTKLKVVAEENAASAPGGENLLINPFSGYILNPAKIAAEHPTAPPVNTVAAKRLLDFLTSPAFQAKLLDFPSAVSPAFLPDAQPEAEAVSALPQTAKSGKRLRLDLRLVNQLPGAPVVNGLSVRLQKSTNGGKSYRNAGRSRKTDANGRVLLRPRISSDTRYRLQTAAFAALGCTGFTAGTADVGVIATGAPRVSRVRLKPTRLTLRTTERGTFRMKIARRTGSGLATVTTARKRKNGAGKVAFKFGSIGAGAYRVTIRARDREGNTRTVRVNRTVGA